MLFANFHLNSDIDWIIYFHSSMHIILLWWKQYWMCSNIIIIIIWIFKICTTNYMHLKWIPWSWTEWPHIHSIMFNMNIFKQNQMLFYTMFLWKIDLKFLSSYLVLLQRLRWTWTRLSSRVEILTISKNITTHCVLRMNLVYISVNRWKIWMQMCIIIDHCRWQYSFRNFSFEIIGFC